MAVSPKLNKDIKGNLSEAQRGARVRAEEIVFGNNQTDKDGNPKKARNPQPDEETKEMPPILKIFNVLKKQGQYTIDDSEELNSLAQLLFHKAKNQAALNDLAMDDNLLDPAYDQLNNRIDKQLKQMKVLRESLGMSHMAKLKKVVDLAKLFIEEEKVKAMSGNNQAQEINPLMIIAAKPQPTLKTIEGDAFKNE